MTNLLCTFLAAVTKEYVFSLENELETFSKLFGSQETNEGLKAFVEKRLPKF